MRTELILGISGVIAGALNAVAGGGSFVVFPAMMFTGIAPVSANATTTVAVWPASVASSIAYRREMPQDRRLMLTLVLVSLVGGAFGGLLLLKTSDATFVKLIPLLIGFAAALFTFGPQVQGFLQRRFGAKSQSLLVGGIVQLVIATYGGYFGAGMGFLMLATFTLMGLTNIHTMNGLKNVLGTALNGVAIVLFVIAGQVQWRPAIAAAIGGVVGGYAGAAGARRIAPEKVRIGVVIFAWGMTGYFAYKAYVA